MSIYARGLNIVGSRLIPGRLCSAALRIRAQRPARHSRMICLRWLYSHFLLTVSEPPIFL
jgi:hypothetical protein